MRVAGEPGAGRCGGAGVGDEVDSRDRRPHARRRAELDGYQVTGSATRGGSRVSGATELLRLDGEPEAGQAPDERLERDLGLEPRERGAEAVVAATAERQMLHVGPVDVQRSGSGNRPGSRFAAFRITITSSPRRIVWPPSSTSFAAQRFSARSTGPRPSASSIAAGSSDESARTLSMMGPRAGWPMAQTIDRRLVAGDDQKHDGAEELLLGERVVGVARRQERADEVVLGRSRGAARSSR